jgi:hypothetical protein
MVAVERSLKATIRKLFAAANGVGYGWLSPDGEFVPVSPRSTHAKVAAGILVSRYGRETVAGMSNQELRESLMQLGWIRLLSDGFEADRIDNRNRKALVNRLQHVAPHVQLFVDLRKKSDALARELNFGNFSTWTLTVNDLLAKL